MVFDKVKESLPVDAISEDMRVKKAMDLVRDKAVVTDAAIEVPAKKPAAKKTSTAKKAADGEEKPAAKKRTTTAKKTTAEGEEKPAAKKTTAKKAAAPKAETKAEDAE